MRTSPRIRIAVACALSIFAVIAAAPSAQASRTDCVPEAGWPAQDASLAAEVVVLVNEYRAQRGLSQVGVSQSLTNAAAWKASQLASDVATYGAGAFAHEDYGTGRAPQARLQACGYGAAFGENIALGQPTARAVMDAWIASDGHRANLEYPAWTAIGVGAAAPGDAAGIGWVQEFGASLPDPVATPTPTPSLAPTPAPTTPTPATPPAPPITAPLVSGLAPPAAGPAAAAPDVRLRKRPRSRMRKRTIRIRWEVSGTAQQLSCKLNGRTLRRCGSNGRTLRRVRHGRHVFRVTVSGPTGTDSERIRWRVVRGR